MSSVCDSIAKYNPCPNINASDVDEYDRDPVYRIMMDCASVEGMARLKHEKDLQDGLRCLAMRLTIPNLPPWWAAIPVPLVTEYLDDLLEPESDGTPVLELAAPHTPLPELIDLAINQLREMDMETGPPKQPSAQEIADFYVRYMNSQAENQPQSDGTSSAPGSSTVEGTKNMNPASLPAPETTSPKAGALEQLYAILEECKASGKALPLYNAKLFGRVTDDGEWKDFIAACKHANKTATNGLHIDIPLLNKKRSNRIAENRNAAEVNRGPVIEIPVRNTIVEPVPPRLNREGLHDSGNAQRLVGYYGQDIRWCGAMKRWLVWDGARWAPDEMERMRKLAMNCMIEFLKQSVDVGDMAAQKFALASLDFKRIRDMLEVTKALVPLHPSQLDTDPMLLNGTNGTVNLATGERRPHKREDYITKLVHHEYRPDAQCPLFLDSLGRAMGVHNGASQEETDRANRMVAWLRRALGYSLTGLTTEKVTFICFGGSNGGKTTLLATILRLIEEYSALLMIDTLMTREHCNNAMADLADLRGARFVMTSETEENQKLAEAKMKRLVQGVEGARIKAAKKFENPITFPETHKIWIDANHLPLVRGGDSGIWNRLCPIPFLALITADRIDQQLPAKLQCEAPGILAWLVAGAIEWRREGLGRPEEVRQARSEWRKDSEVLKEFFDDHCVRKHGSYVLCTDIWNEYEAWCNAKKREQKDYQKLTRDKFVQRLEDIGFKRVMHRFDQQYPERAWEGIALL